MMEGKSVNTPSQRKTRKRNISDPDISQIAILHLDDEENMRAEITELTRVVVDLKNVVLNQLKTLTEEVKSMKEQFLITATPIETEQKLEEIVNKVKEIDEKLINKNNVCDTRNKTREPVNMPSISSNIIRNKELSERKISYYNHLHNKDRFDIYTEMLTKDPPQLPARFTPVEIRNEPPIELIARQKLEHAKLTCYMSVLENRSKVAKEKYLMVDNKVLNDIENSNYEDAEKARQREVWTQKTVAEEEVSRKLWAKKRDDIIELPKKQRENGRIVEKNSDAGTYAIVTKRGLVNNEKENDGWQQVTYRNNRNTHSNRYTQMNTSRGRGGTEQSFRRQGYPQRGQTYRRK